MHLEQEERHLQGRDIPFVSVITVVRNDLEGFSKTDESLRKQEFDGYEWIVIDGSSTDGTVEAIKHRANRIAKYISEPDGGIYDAMNKGLRLSRGKYVLFLNAGDTLADCNVLADVTSELMIRGNPDVIFGGSIMSFGQRIKIRRRAKSPRYIWHGQPGLHQATFFKRSTHLDVPFNASYRICGDYDVLARLWQSGASFQSISRIVSVNDFGAASTSARNKMQLTRECAKIQHDILRHPGFLIALSATRRTLANVIAKILSNVASWK